MSYMKYKCNGCEKIIDNSYQYKYCNNCVNDLLDFILSYKKSCDESEKFINYLSSGKEMFTNVNQEIK